jgi:hypothetical protein
MNYTFFIHLFVCPRLRLYFCCQVLYSFGLLHLFGFCSTAFVCYIGVLHLFWSAASIWFLFYCICLLYWCAASLLVCCIYLVFVLLHLSVILFCYISFGRLHLFSLLHLFGFCSTASVCCIYLVFVLLHLKCGIILISFHFVW